MAFGPESSKELVPPHKVFVSYAHVDDQPQYVPPSGFVNEAPLGWVATLTRLLRLKLDEHLGRRNACHIWVDYELRGSDILHEAIKGELEQSGAFVGVLSHGYLAAAWCCDELRFYLGCFGAELGNRIFLIEKYPIDVDDPLPNELEYLWRGRQARRGYQFWYPDRNGQPRTYATPIPDPRDPAEKEYFRLIDDLARDLRTQLRGGSGPGDGGGRGAGAPEPYRPLTGGDAVRGVLLAEVTSDLEPRRQAVRRYLEQRGILVFPENPYPRGRTEFEAGIDRDLRRSELFVQLLGGMPGGRSPDVPEGYAWLQLDRAQHGNVPILQWRSTELDLDEIEWPRQRELLELETVRATSLESFKRSVVAALAQRPAPRPSRHISGLPLIFLNVEPQHSDAAAQIREAVGDRVAWVKPLYQGSAEEVRIDLEQNVIDCDAMVMVYAGNTGWLRAQLRTFNKLAPRRERRVQAIIVVNASQEGQPELGFDLHDVVVADVPEVLPRLAALGL
jgi:hypothetical protein